MAKLTPGMKQDWKQRPANNGRPMKRMVRLVVVGTLFVALLAVLIWFLLPPSEQRTYFFAANPIEYDLLATMPLVHSSVADTVSEEGNHDPKSFLISRVTVGDFPPLDQVAREASRGHLPGWNDACVLYLQAHTIRFDAEGQPHVVVAMPRFLRNSLADWEQEGVLDLNVLFDWIETANCPTKLVLLDAGTIVTDGQIDLYQNNFAAALEAEFKKRDSSLFLITSHDDGQKSLSRSLHSNSIFSQAIQEALIGKDISDQNNDHQLSLDELYHHICVRVKDHIGTGSIAQTPRLFQGGEGILVDDFPSRFICRYLREDPLETALEDKAAEKKKPGATPPPPPPKPDAKDGTDGASETDTKDKEKDPRWTTLFAVWQLRDQLAAPPAARGDQVWSPIDFAPQDFRRLDDYLIGFQFRLLYNSGTVEEGKLIKMQQTLTALLQGIQTGTEVNAPDRNRENSPDENLVEAWNTFINSPYYAAWSADLTDQGLRARNDILGWNYCLYYVPQLTQLFDLTGTDSSLSENLALLREIRDVSVAMVSLPSADKPSAVIDRLPFGNAIQNAISQIQTKQRLMGSNLEITSPQSNPNAAMADTLRLIAYLQTSLPSPADRQTMIHALRDFSDLPIPKISFVSESVNVLSQLSSGPLPRVSEASMKQLRELHVEIAASDNPPSGDAADAFFQLGRRVEEKIASDTNFPEQVRYNVLVRTLDWRDMPQTIVREVPPLPIRFPVKEKLPHLVVDSSSQSQTIDLETIDRIVDFSITLDATNFTSRNVSFTVKYDKAVLDVAFKNGSFDPNTGILSYRVDASGPLKIEGYASAKLNREQNAARKNQPNVRLAQNETIEFSIPAELIPPGAQNSRVAKLDASLPWADVVELVVQQPGADQPGIFYGPRVQIPLFDNRNSEFKLGVVNRSKLPRSVKVSLYPVVRPPNSVMPRGRIFSQNYHRKPAGNGPGTQGEELEPWRLFSFEIPLANKGADFAPTGIATAANLPKTDQIPPVATRARGNIINAPVDPSRVNWLTFQGPPGPPGPDGKPGQNGKIAATDMSNGLLVVIEDEQNKHPDGSPIRWLRFVEFVARHPKDYLDLQTTVVPVNLIRKLDMVVQPISGNRALPLATWDSEPLTGFVGLPQDLAKVPIRVAWDWAWNGTFGPNELKERQAFGSLNSPTATANLGAILNLDRNSPVERPVLLNVSSAEELPTLRRAFRDVMNLSTGRLNVDASAGFQTLWLDSYQPHIHNEEKPTPPIAILAQSWPENRMPIILPSDTDSVDWMLALSTDTNSFNYASETNPNTIQLGLLEGQNNFLSARPDFTETLYSNRSFGVTLTKSLSEGQLVFAASLQDINAPNLSTKTQETFVGNFVVEVRTGQGLVNSLQIPVVIDKDPPTINIGPTRLDIPVNDGQKITIPVADSASGIKQLEIGAKGPGDTIADKPKIIEPLVGNIVSDPNDPFQRRPQFILNIRPEDFKWDFDTTHILRVVAVNRANLRSKPLDLQIRVLPKVAEPNDVDPMPMMAIQAQVVFVNGRVAEDPKYRPTIKEMPGITAIRAQDGKSWIFQSRQLKAGTNYTLQTSARQSSGGIASAETTAQATPAKDQGPVYQLKFK